MKIHLKYFSDLAFVVLYFLWSIGQRNMKNIYNQTSLVYIYYGQSVRKSLEVEMLGFS